MDFFFNFMHYQRNQIFKDIKMLLYLNMESVLKRISLF